MFSEIFLRSEHKPNNSATSGVLAQRFDFGICEGIEGGRYVWGVCAIVSFAFGFPATVAILWEMFKTHRRGAPFTPNELFMLNLSIMDAVFLAVVPPGLLNHFIFHSGVFEEFWDFTYTLNTCGRPLLMACTCLDCYLAVVHPITYHKIKSLTPRVVMAGIVWTLTVANGILYVLFAWLYYTMFPIVPFITALVIIGICDSFIFYTLVRSDSGRKNIHPQKQRAIQTLVNSLVMAILSYLPPVFLIIIGKLLIRNYRTFICTIAIPMTICSTLGSAIMPLLYLHNHGKLDRFRLGWRR